MTNDELEQAKEAEVYEIIRRPPFNGSFITYPKGDAEQRDLYETCVRLTEKGFLVEHTPNDGNIVAFKVVGE